MARSIKPWIYLLVLFGLLAAGLTAAPGSAEAAVAWVGDWSDITKTDGFATPRSIAIDGEDNVYVLDSGLKVVFKRSASGNWSYIASDMGFAGESDSPWGIASHNLDLNNRIYLLNSIQSTSRVVWRYDITTKKWTDITYGQLFRQPEAITVYKDGAVYVTDSYDNGNFIEGHVLKLPAGGTAWTEIGDWENGQFEYVPGITVDGNGGVFVTDYSTGVGAGGRIRRLTAPGGSWETYPSTSEGFRLKRPIGIVRDNLSNLYVADSERKEIHARPNDSSLWWWYIKNGEPNTFSEPTGVAVDSQGYVYVTDPANKKVYKHPPWATQLKWQTQPGGAVAGSALNPQPVVVLAGSSEVITGDSSSTINVSLTNANGASLGGQSYATLNNGVASFGGLSVDKAGTYTLTATGSIPNISTSNYNYYPNAAGPSTLTRQSGSFTIAAPPQAAVPTASITSGTTVANNTAVTLATTTTGATIYYTTDGSDPTTGSSNGTSVVITGAPESTVTVKAIAGGAGFTSSPVATFTYTLQAQAAAPTALPASGTTVANNTTVTLSTATAGATIHYTTNGSNPTTSSTSGASVIITGAPGAAVTVKAMAVATNMANSEIAIFTYNLQPQAAAPTASPPSGSIVTDGSTAALSTTTAGATIYYTTDGSAPTLASPSGASVIITGLVGNTITVQALAVVAGMENSEIATFSYTIAQQVEAPTASPDSGTTIANGTTVTLSTTTTGATIYYTNDGSDPASGSTSGNSVTISGAPESLVTVKAFATAPGMVDSPIETFTYTLQPLTETPTAVPPSGSVVVNNTTVTLLTSLSNATIYYTLNGSAPTTSSDSGSSVIISGVPGDTITLKALAVVPERENSDIATFTYTIGLPAESPTASILSGATVANNTVVGLTSATPNTTIYYTLDGCDPSRNSLSGSSATISGAPAATVILKAMAIAPGMADSDIAIFTYYLQPQAAPPTAIPTSGSTVENHTTVTLATTTAGATIYYTTDSTNPTASSAAGNSVIIGGAAGTTVTVKAFAAAPDMADSQVAVFTYRIRSSSSGGSDGGGGGGGTPSGILVTPPGGAFKEQGIIMVFPANAVEDDIRVQVREVSEGAGLSLPENSRLLSKVVDIIKDSSGDFSRPVTITLSIDRSQADPEKFEIKICYYDEETGQWAPLDNIQVNLTTGQVSGEVTHFTKFAIIAVPKAIKPVAEPQPTVKIPVDVTGHWAQGSVMKLMEAGVVSGYPDGTFKPDKTISRAEFTVMLVEALKLKPQDTKEFADISTHWAKGSIITAASHGIISGYNESTFGPDDLVTREQAALIIARAACCDAGASNKSFADSDRISAWAGSGVKAAVSGGFFNGYPDGSFQPQGNINRAEAAVVIAKLLL